MGLSLLVMGTILDDVTACSDAIRATEDMWMLTAFLLYILLNSFTMMNMLVGILVEVVGNTAEGEKQRLLQEGVKESIMTIFTQMDQDCSGMISKEEFQQMKHDAKVMEALSDLDINEPQFDKYVQLLFQSDDNGVCASLSCEKLLDAICRLRPGTAVSALDFASFRQSVSGSQTSVKARIQRIETLFAEVDQLALENNEATACNVPAPAAANAT